MKWSTYLPVRAARFPALLVCFWLGCNIIHLHAQTVSIMPLGDSLTYGYDSSDPTDTGGYRSPLYGLLTTAGYGVNYVGVNTENPSPTLTAAGQTAHNGFGGYTIDNIDDNLNGSPAALAGSNLGGYWLTGGHGMSRGPESADIILLQIGANDITQNYDPAYTGPAGQETDSQFASDEAARLENLVKDIKVLDPNALILVDGTTPIFFTQNDYTLVHDYDLDVATKIANDFQGQNVDYVDMWDAILENKIPGYELYSSDAIHLNAEGYSVMAQAWDNAILADYNFNADPAPVPEPSTYVLFAFGALALFGWRRLRKD